MIKTILQAVGIIFGLFILLAIILPTPPEEIAIVNVDQIKQQVESQQIDSFATTSEEIASTTELETSEEQALAVDDVTEAKSVPVTPEPKMAEVQETTPDQIKKENYYEVVSVVDGDTVKLNINGAVESVRLIGIDTPETVHPSKPVECFGIEASNKAKQILTGQTVRFETDSSQGDRDKYGRLLGYLFLSDGTNFNKIMIEQGYAYEYTYSVPYQYQAEFKSAEQYARTNGVGLWADGVCEDESVSDDNTTQAQQSSTSSGGKWYVSSHYSSKYYYCEESDGWKGLSEKYLQVYNSEAALLADFSTHTLHESCQ